jgi:ATP-binding protein involved in chromosome partitioning
VIEPNRNAILKALEGVIDPELRKPVTELDMVRDVEIDGGDVRVTIALTVAGCPLRDSFQEQVANVMRDVPGVERVALGFDVMTAEERQALTTKPRGGFKEGSASPRSRRTSRSRSLSSARQ